MKEATWFITGVSSGIGNALARQLLENGVKVIGTAREPEVLQQLKQDNGSRFSVLQLDVTDFDSTVTVTDEVFESHEAIDVVVNNAGVAIFRAIEELTIEQIKIGIDTNLLGSMRVIQACLPHLRKQGHGRIIQISSLGGQIAVPGMSVYHASKWGIEGFIESCRQDLASFNIDFTIVEPGITETQAMKEGHFIRGNPLSAYQGSPSANVITQYTAPSFVAPNSPGKAADAIIASSETSPAPLRVTLGEDSLNYIEQSLEARLVAIREAKVAAAAVV